jgi:hypothetical protein
MSAEPEARRPLAVTLVVALTAVVAGLDLVVGVLLLTGVDSIGSVEGMTQDQVTLSAQVVGGVFLLFGVIQLVVAYQLAKGSNGARLVVTVILVAQQLHSLYLGAQLDIQRVPGFAGLAIAVVILLLVWNPVSSRWFDRGRDSALATRAAWFLALAPAAFVLVMGYTEGTTIALAIGMFLALRSQRWWIAAVVGILAGLTRPSGFLLAIPAFIEALRGLKGLPLRAYFARAPAVVGPGVGTLLYLLWVGHQFGDMWLPYSIQTESGRRGSFTNPIDTIDHALHGLFNGNAVGTGLHVPWLVLVVVLVVICFRTWPASYSVFAAVSILSAVVSSNLDSFERYTLAAFPLILVVATLTKDRRVERSVLVLSGSAMTVYALLAFFHAYVP